jgi:hypothetical protein
VRALKQHGILAGRRPICSRLSGPSESSSLQRRLALLALTLLLAALALEAFLMAAIFVFSSL